MVKFNFYTSKTFKNGNRYLFTFIPLFIINGWSTSSSVLQNIPSNHMMPKLSLEESSRLVGHLEAGISPTKVAGIFWCYWRIVSWVASFRGLSHFWAILPAAGDSSDNSFFSSFIFQKISTISIVEIVNFSSSNNYSFSSIFSLSSFVSSLILKQWQLICFSILISTLIFIFKQ